jgi:hypothetical protein
MKLADLEKVGKLKTDRDYLLLLKDYADASYLTMKVAAASAPSNLRPDLIEAIRPALKLALANAVAEVDRDLAALGVTAEEDAEP